MPGISRAAVEWQHGTAKRKPPNSSFSTHRFSLPTHRVAATCFRHPKDDSEELHWCEGHKSMMLCQAAQPQHPQQQAIPKSAFLVPAIEQQALHCRYPRCLHRATAAALPGRLWAPVFPITLMSAPLWPPGLSSALQPAPLEHLAHRNHICQKHASLLLSKLQPLEGNPALRVPPALHFDTTGSR